MKQSQAQLSADHETAQSLFGKHNYWKLLTTLHTLTAQVTKGNITAQSCVLLALKVRVDIDERGRFPENITPTQPFYRIIPFGTLIIQCILRPEILFSKYLAILKKIWYNELDIITLL